MLRFISLLLVGFVLSGCSFWGSDPGFRAKGRVLSKEYAELRKKNIDNVNYRLNMNLAEQEGFSGWMQVSFTQKAKFDLSLDFFQGQIKEMKVNGETLPADAYNGFYVTIPWNLQKVGSNNIEISFKQNYSKNGTGLYRSVDPVDDRTYIYSQFEPYFANMMFPCFDQPDLKASYTLEVTAPKDWQVISSRRETQKRIIGDLAQWGFPPTDRFSTYTFSLHAGDYRVWTETYKRKSSELELRLLARQSMASFVDPKEWFTTTQQGLEFFESYFGRPYPYSKYDQIIVPDYNHGAMENVGAVTFSESRFITKGEKTRDQKRRLAITLLHEMAHMWFGNLVTMHWWGDLWLNESFATYASFLAAAKATEYEEVWAVVNQWSKQKAYDLDRSPNTHPIKMAVSDTNDAFAHFDDITYGKGAAALRQLSFRVGAKKFKKALRNYFEKYAEANASSEEFMAEIMEQAPDGDIATWSTRWLSRASVNEIQVNFTCRRGRIKLFEIYQTATAEHPFLRTHKTRVALFRKSGSQYKVNSVHSVVYSGGRTRVKKLEGKLCPHIVYPNYEDYDFVLVKLDRNSLRHISTNLAAVNNSVLRGMLWEDLWRMVKNHQLSAERFLEIVEFNGLSETDPENLQRIAKHVEHTLNHYFPRQGPIWSRKRQVWLKFFEQFYLNQIKETAESKQQELWFDSLLLIGESENVLVQLSQWLTSSRSQRQLAFKLSQEKRWLMVARLAEFEYPNIDVIMKNEAERDPSGRGLTSYKYAQSLRGNIDNKAKVLSTIVNRGDRSLGDLKPLLQGLFPLSQQQVQKGFIEEIFHGLDRLVKQKDDYLSRLYVEEVLPQFCDKKSSTRIQKYMAANKEVSFPVVKALRRALFENDRCYKARKMLMQYPSTPGVY